MEFLTTKQIVGSIESLIKDANEELVIVTPYVQLSPLFYERLIDADERNVKIDFIFGKREINYEEEEKITFLNNINLFFLQNLHAKCYLNESKVIITSMNLYEYSENNREMGIVLERKENYFIYNDIKREIDSIIKRSIVLKSRMEMQQSKGFCIRCKNHIYFDISKPLCFNCYKVWQSFSNPDYRENYCTCCGKQYETSFSYPLCHTCASKFRFIN